MRYAVHEHIEEVPAQAWDALCGDDDPFIEHAFLRLLEDSGAVGAASTGWMPRHVTVWDKETLVGALPLYLKLHSFGEYIFDWAFAGASQQLGAPYYPKLVSMVPFTPATGKRVLLANNVDRSAGLQAMLEGLRDVQRVEGASSMHWLFLREEECRTLVQAAMQRPPSERLLPRASLQFHWENAGDADFEAYLGRFRSALRKQVRKERRKANEQVDVIALLGADIEAADWQAMADFYRNTCEEHGSETYLPPAFFSLAKERLGTRPLMLLAKKGSQTVAATLNFAKGKHLYGRYWGACEPMDSVHFELCYHRPIEIAIQENLSRFEAGAQGIHKLRRGLMPTVIHSAHTIAHPVLRRAVEDFLPREAAAVREEIEALAAHGPFSNRCQAQVIE